MGTPSAEISITGLNRNDVRPASKQGWLEYPFQLSATPDRVWVETYNETVSHRMFHSDRCEAEIKGDKLVVYMTADDKPQRQLDIQKEVLASVNASYATYLEQEAKRAAAAAKKKKEEEDALENLRKKSDDLKF